MRYILPFCAVSTRVHLDFTACIYEHTTDTVQFIAYPITPRKLRLIFRDFFLAILNLVERTHIIRENHLVLHVRPNTFKVFVLRILGFQMFFNNIIDVVFKHPVVIFVVVEKRVVGFNKQFDDVCLLVLLYKSHRVFVDCLDIKLHFPISIII